MSEQEREAAFNELADQLLEIWAHHGENGNRERIDTCIRQVRQLQEALDDAEESD